MKGRRVLLILVAAVGLVASILLTNLHYRMGQHGFDERSFCNVSEIIDCDSVLASRYSQIKTPWISIPNSELGIIYYCLFIVGVLYAGLSPRNHRSMMAFLLVSIILALIYSVAMAFISFVELGVICFLCATTYVVNVILFLLLPETLGIKYREIPQFLKGYGLRLIGRSPGGKLNFSPRPVFHGILVVVILGVGLLFFKNLNPNLHRIYPEISWDRYLSTFLNQPQVSIPVEGVARLGSPEAKIQIVEFSDFECPFCKRAAFTIKASLKEFRKDVVFYFVNYPLDQTCNPGLEATLHPSACLASKAALCANSQGKFWDYHDLVFENQKKISRALLVDLAAAAKLDGPAFEDCFLSTEADQMLAHEIAIGEQTGVRGTPSIFINGRLFRDWNKSDRLRRVIEALLKR